MSSFLYGITEYVYSPRFQVRVEWLREINRGEETIKPGEISAGIILCSTHLDDFMKMMSWSSISPIPWPKKAKNYAKPCTCASPHEEY